MRVLIIEGEPYLAEAIRDALRLEATAADIAGDGDTALHLLNINTYDIAVLEVLAAEGGVISAEELRQRASDENADPFTSAVRITISALRKRMGQPWIIAAVAGVGYRIDIGLGAQEAGGDDA